MTKPTYLNAKSASAFKARNVAEFYVCRPPYAAQAYQTLLSLIPDGTRMVLDAGCGPGKIGRGLTREVDRVDAIDFSAEMIRVGRGLPQGDHPALHWMCATIEEAPFAPAYGLIVAGASLHWMDWERVFPRFVSVLVPDGFLALVSGDEPSSAPWLAARKALIAEYSMNQEYRPFNMVVELSRQGYFEQVGEKRTDPILFKQTIEAFLKSEHSRQSLAVDEMGPERAAQFDEKMRGILEPYSTDAYINYEISTRIVWGKPLPSPKQ